jgi:hypothetical protein
MNRIVGDRRMSLFYNARTSTVFILSVECKLRSSIPLTTVVAILQHAQHMHGHAAAQFVFVALKPNL